MYNTHNSSKTVLCSENNLKMWGETQKLSKECVYSSKAFPTKCDPSGPIVMERFLLEFMDGKISTCQRNHASIAAQDLLLEKP
jgi:hypothetical protein